MSTEAIKRTGYFYINNGIFIEDISANAKIVYMYLCKCADYFGKSWPAHKTIAGACSLSVSSLKLAIKELKERKLLTVSPRYREEGGKSSNLYMIMNRTKNNSFWCNSNIFKMSISSKAKLIYFYFCRCCNKEGTCYPAHRTTAAACMVSISAVRMAIKELIEAKFLEVASRFRENNGQTSNLYTVLSPVIEVIGTTVKKAASALARKSATVSKEKKKASGLIACIQSYINRGLRHCIAGGMSKRDHERTIPKLRTNHIEGL
ncbi:MAG: helix-turn-helix domain-containing protein [Eubacteriales bacterium]|nr:helix-turn-helix domain-containing protein [Eubacteriales bacterium]